MTTEPTRDGKTGLVPWNPGRGISYETVLAAEVEALRDVVRELVRNDGFYGGAPCWQRGSYAAEVFARAMAERCHADASYSGVDKAALDDPNKVWRCDSCGAEGILGLLDVAHGQAAPNGSTHADGER